MKRLFLFLVAFLLFLAAPLAAQAQEPGTITGIIQDQDPLTGAPVTRSVTLTLVMNTKAITLDTGNTLLIDRTLSVGDVVSGAPSLIVAGILLFIYVKGLARGRIA